MKDMKLFDEKVVVPMPDTNNLLVEAIIVAVEIIALVVIELIKDR